MDRTKNIVVVGISEMAVSQDQNDILVTYSLGSCVGVAMHDPVTGVCGMIHCMLPSPTNYPLLDKGAEKKAHKPCMFVDTGMTKLLTAMFEKGVEKKNIICKVAGAGNQMDDDNIFGIGMKNYDVLKKFLAKNSIAITSELVGGQTPKTMIMTVATGQTFVKLTDKEEREI